MIAADGTLSGPDGTLSGPDGTLKVTDSIQLGTEKTSSEDNSTWSGPDCTLLVASATSGLTTDEDQYGIHQQMKIKNKNCNAVINVIESIYYENNYIIYFLSARRMQNVRSIGVNRKEGSMIKSIFQNQQLMHRPVDKDRVNSLLAHLSEITILQLKSQNTMAQRYHEDRRIEKNIDPNFPQYNAATYKPLEGNPYTTEVLGKSFQVLDR